MLFDLIKPKVNSVGMHSQLPRRLFDVETAFSEGADRAEEIVPLSIGLMDIARPTRYQPQRGFIGVTDDEVVELDFGERNKRMARPCKLQRNPRLSYRLGKARKIGFLKAKPRTCSNAVG